MTASVLLTRVGDSWRRVGRDTAYVLPGLPIAIFSFSLLLVLLSTSLATVVVWLGALLLPLTLVIASAFAALSRSRLRHWGTEPGVVTYRTAGPGLMGKLRLVADPRRWLDLVFEMLIAFPLRLITFVVAVVWLAAAPAGLTYFFWSLFLPDERSFLQLLELIDADLVPDSASGQYLLDAGAHFAVGLIFFITIPLVMRALAILDATLTTALLGTGIIAAESSSRPRAARAGDGAASPEVVSFSAAAWSWIGASFSAVVLLAVGWPVTSAVYSVNAAVAMALVGLHCASVVLTLRWVWPGLGASLAASAGLMMVTAGAEVAVWPWPVTVMITQCAVLAVAALAAPWYCAASGWCAGALVTLGALLLSSPEIPPGALSTGIVFVSVSAGVVLLGVLARLWILNAGRLEAAQRSSAEQDRRRKELEERNRIARELHDVVAHSMSVISVQAATAQYRNPDINDAARQEFREIASSSRQALAEMRMLLSILRGDDDVPTAPEPGLEDLDSLIEATRASGTTIRYRGLGDSGEKQVPRASSAVGLAAYRIIQEALSNALRHSPGAVVEVELEILHSTAGPQLMITVSNSAPPESNAIPAPGAGLGLEGIRERASAVGGHAATGPVEGGGFSVRASLPLDPLLE